MSADDILTSVESLIDLPDQDRQSILAYLNEQATVADVTKDYSRLVTLIEWIGCVSGHFDQDLWDRYAKALYRSGEKRAAELVSAQVTDRDVKPNTLDDLLDEQDDDRAGHFAKIIHALKL
ncbi:MAG: hypothetical protein AAF296_02290 [Pseudomonadota bacterium]